MKKNTTRVLCLMLTLVMLLSAVPFAAATSAETPADPVYTTQGMSIYARPSGSVWANEDVKLQISGQTASGLEIDADSIKWYSKVGTAEKAEIVGADDKYSIDVNPAEDTTYIVQYTVPTTDAEGAATTLYGEEKIAVDVKVPARADAFVFCALEEIPVGQKAELTITGLNDSDVTWTATAPAATAGGTALQGTVTKSGNKWLFSADTKGTYTIKATVTTGPDTEEDEDDKEQTRNLDPITINVVDATYTGTLTPATASVAVGKTTQLTGKVMQGTTDVTTTVTPTYTTSAASVATVSSSGLVTGVTVGTATISLKVGTAVLDTTTITVTETSGIELKEKDYNFDADDDDEVKSSAVELEFSLPGVAVTGDVDWEFEVVGLHDADFIWSANSKDEYKVEDDEKITLKLKASDGCGVAKIKVWADSSKHSIDEEAVFYISVYDTVDYVFELKDKTEKFDFDEKVFSKVTKNGAAVTASTATISGVLDVDMAELIELSESRSANQDVGEISGNNYDEDKDNVMEVKDVKDLEFEVDDEGYYLINYKQYEEIDTDGDLTKEVFKVLEGTIKIVNGEANADIVYGGGTKTEDQIKINSTFDLDEDDFEEFWEEYCEEKDIDDELDYVKFNYKPTSINGTLVTDSGKKSMSSTYKFYFEYDKDTDKASSNFDLDDITYKSHATKGDYTDEVTFTCYGEKSSTPSVTGVVSFVVGKGTSSTMSFTDVKTTDWFYDEVLYVYTNGIMAGTSTTKFSPSNTLTRGMVVTMLHRVESEVAPTKTNPFSDVKAGDYYYNAVRWAAENDIVNGMTTTTFAPNSPITREQLAAILYRYTVNYKKESVSSGSLIGFPDASSVSNYAEAAMKWAVGAGIISGDNTGKLNPKGNATRAEAAAMFQRFLEK